VGRRETAISIFYGISVSIKITTLRLQITNYTFNAIAKTVTFTDYTTIRLDSVLIITNVTDNLPIYNFTQGVQLPEYPDGLGGTVSGNVLTLHYDTSAMSDGDSLQIFYDDGDIQPANAELQTTLYSLTETLQELTARLTVLASTCKCTRSDRDKHIFIVMI